MSLFFGKYSPKRGSHRWEMHNKGWLTASFVRGSISITSSLPGYLVRHTTNMVRMCGEKERFKEKKKKRKRDQKKVR